MKKIKDTIEFFAGRDDVVLWWRPHPLAGGTISSMRPQLFEEYVTVVGEYKESGIGIYDDTADHVLRRRQFADLSVWGAGETDRDAEY